ncbi:CCHC-type domain-containing protein [Trichonephila clavipes]|nr:CCHC-type domain-containing protein [Trichonephila clavipes]
MPTEQEAKPAVVTPSLQQWRSPSTFRGAPGEDPLKWLKEYDRVANFNKREYTVLHTKCIRLCQEVNPLMKEDEKVSHLMKGVAEDIYQALLTREINDTASFIKWCNYIEDMKQKRVGRPRFERLPNVVPVASLTDETDLVSLIRTNQEIVQDEVERVLAPVSTKPTETRPRPTYAAVTRKYRAPVQKFPPEPRKQIERLSLTIPRNRRRNFDDVGTEEEIRRPNSSRRFTPSPTRGRSPIRRYRSPSPYRRSSQSPGRRSEENQRERPSKEDGLLEASQAVIDCGQNELVLEDICRDSTAPDA